MGCLVVIILMESSVHALDVGRSLMSEREAPHPRPRASRRDVPGMATPAHWGRIWLSANRGYIIRTPHGRGYKLGQVPPFYAYEYSYMSSPFLASSAQIGNCMYIHTEYVHP
jgi:hypothetical protein